MNHEGLRSFLISSIIRVLICLTIVYLCALFVLYYHVKQFQFYSPVYLLETFQNWIQYLTPARFVTVDSRWQKSLVVLCLVGLVIPALASFSILTPVFLKFRRKSNAPKTSIFRGLEREDNLKKFLKLLDTAIPKRIRGIFIHQSVYLPKSAESEGILVLGGTGSGKTKSVINRIAKQAFQKNEKLIVLDSKGDFTSAYIGDPHVHLLAPWDSRSIRWGMSADISRLSDVELIASAILPSNASDPQPIFRDTAYEILVALMKSLFQDEKLSWGALYKTINDSSLLNNSLSAYPSGAAALKIISGNREQAEIYLSTLRTRTTFLENLSQAWQDDHNLLDFSLRDWMRDGKGGMLILRYASDFIDISRKTSSLAISIAISELLSWPVANQNPVWFILDEIANLQTKIGNLAEGVTAGRERGAKFVLASQDVSRLDHVYGMNESRSILNSLRTFIAFSSGDKLNCEYAASCLGGEREELIQTFSTGFSQSDGKNKNQNTSLNCQETLRTVKIVLDSEIKCLGKGQAFLRMPGLPVTKLQFDQVVLNAMYPHESLAPWVNAREVRFSANSEPGQTQSTQNNDPGDAGKNAYNML